MKCSLAFFTKRSLSFFKALKNGQKTRSLFLGSGCWSSKFSGIINSDVSILPNIQMIFLGSVLSFNIAGKNIYIFKLLCNNFPINLSIHIFAILARDVIYKFWQTFLNFDFTENILPINQFGKTATSFLFYHHKTISD